MKAYGKPCDSENREKFLQELDKSRAKAEEAERNNG